MWIVFDDNKYIPYGPFQSKDEAEDWLAAQGITMPYGEQEVSVIKLKGPDEKLPMI